jgi:glycosyltransferase involved in cell wall biosynthesis
MKRDVVVDPEIWLLMPKKDVKNPEISIVVPAMNEELTIGEFIDWCLEGLKKANVAGEILIISSSTDNTSKIAVTKGARVLETPRRGLGRAYIDAIPHIRGKYCILGDADLTYDFREIKPFVEKFRKGFEYIMGSRFKGYIEKGAMPFLHKYFGTPVTTWILNIIYSSKFSDIHCGMRGITKDAFMRIRLKSQSWEYASEMVLKSVHWKLKTAEVPIRFYKDRDCRQSHHKREGWFSPWKAAWINLKAMFIYGADFFLVKPGIGLLVAGLLLTLPITFGPVTIGVITFSLFWMLLGLTLSVLGMQFLYMGIMAKLLFDYHGRISSRIVKIFNYNRSVGSSVILFLFGLLLVIPLLAFYYNSGFVLDKIPESAFMAVTGLEFMILSFINFSFTLLFHGTLVIKNEK